MIERACRGRLTSISAILKIAGAILAILLVATGVIAGWSDYPADLAKWISTQPPQVLDDRWVAANHDTKNEWVVFLLEGRPSVRLRAVKQEKGSHYPEMQESYPVMPFKVPRGSAKDGLAGEWFSLQVSDGWIIGFNAGEFGAGLWWFSPDGKRREKISEDRVVGFFATDAGLLALEGIATVAPPRPDHPIGHGRRWTLAFRAIRGSERRPGDGGKDCRRDFAGGDEQSPAPRSSRHQKDRRAPG